MTTTRGLLAALALFSVLLSSCGWSKLSEAAARPAETSSGVAEHDSSVEDGERISAGPEQITDPQGNDQISGDAAQSAADATSAPSSTPTSSTTTTTPVPRLFGDTIAPHNTRSTWVGRIDEGEIAREVTLWLAEKGAFILGQITYADTGSSRTLAGRRLNGGFTILEFNGAAQISRTFTSSSITNGVFGGLTAGGAPASLTLESIIEDETTFSGGLHAGTYRYAFGPFEGAERCCGPFGSLTLSALDPASATAAITTQTGVPSPELAAIEPSHVAVHGNTARFEQRNDWLDCAFDIIGFGDVVFVDQFVERQSCGFSDNASVHGIYLRADS